jgi:hypothetical protein
VTSLCLTKNIMQRFWHKRSESGARAGRAKFPSLDVHRQ